MSRREHPTMPLSAKAFLDYLDENKKHARALIDDHTVYMKESVFAGLYLPYIIGEKTDPIRLRDPDTCKYTYIEWQQMWLGAVKSFATKVTVYNPQTKRILFDVPPLNYLAGIRRPPKVMDTQLAVNHYFTLQKSSRGGEEAFMEARTFETLDEFLDANDRTLTPQVRNNILEVWDYIIKRYTGVTVRLNTNVEDSIPTEHKVVQEVKDEVFEEMSLDDFD